MSQVRIPDDLQDLIVNASRALVEHTKMLEVIGRRKNLTSFERSLLDTYRQQVIERRTPLTYQQRQTLVQVFER